MHTRFSWILVLTTLLVLSAFVGAAPARSVQAAGTPPATSSPTDSQTKEEVIATDGNAVKNWFEQHVDRSKDKIVAYPKKETFYYTRGHNQRAQVVYVKVTPAPPGSYGSKTLGRVYYKLSGQTDFDNFNL